MGDFEQAIDIVLFFEGGYVDHPDDPGGETKYGISKRSYPNVDIASLTLDDAKAIYHRDFWTPVASRVADPRLRLLAFDSAVNHGLARALAWLDEHPTFERYVEHRLFFYTNLSTWPTFGKGWTRRVGHVIRAAGFATTRVEKLVDNRSWWARLAAAIAGVSGPVAYRVRPLTEGNGWKMDVRSE